MVGVLLIQWATVRRGGGFLVHRARWRPGPVAGVGAAAPALMPFANRLRSYWRGILSRVQRPIQTGQLEGINNRFKVIKRMVYG